MPPSVKPADNLERGRRVGKYELITRLSVGGMAELFLAFIPGPGGFKKFVALKQILPDVRADESFVKMFLDEARITAAFNHPHIGQVFDLGKDDDELYLAMEFIAGQNLEQTIKRAAKREVAIPVGFAARVVRDAALGLYYAHHFTDPTGQPMAVVHRDVSPKNVMITWTGQVKVIDFGIAKARGRLNRTQIGIVKGTSGYMSPEQVKNEPLDGRTDLFAAAVMLHEMLAGERLFTAPTDAGMMLKIVDGDVTPPGTNNPYVTPQLSDVVMKGLEKNRENRWATGREFARAIEQACPELFEDEQMAEFMGQLFEDKIAITRSLLEAANTGDSEQEQVVKRAASVLTTDERDPENRPAKVTGSRNAPARSTATPHPRPGLKSGASSQRLPRVTAKSSQRLPMAGTAKSSQRLARVPAAPDDETVRPGSMSSPFKLEGDDPNSTIPPKRSQMKLAPVGPTPRTAAPQPPTVIAADAGPPPSHPDLSKKKSGGAGGLVAVLVIVALLAGLGWAVFAGPLKDKLKLLDEPPPQVDTGPKKIEAEAAPNSEKPAWVLEKEKQKAQQEEEKRLQKEMEAAANDPERRALLAQLEADLKQLDYLEAEQRSLKLAAQQGQANNNQRIDDLQKQIDALKNQVASNQKKSSAPKKAGDPGEIEVINDSKSAKNAKLGYFSLRTINPPTANVLLAGDSLGSTPLTRVPLEAGTHRLVVVDGDGRSRLLSVSIEAGKTAEFRAVDVSTLPLAP